MPDIAQSRTAPPPLFASLPHNGTATSIAAAQIKRSTADSDRNRIAVYLHARPEGATRQQLAKELGIKDDSVRPRVRELIEGGFLFEAGDTREWDGHQPSKVLRHTVHRKD